MQRLFGTAEIGRIKASNGGETVEDITVTLTDGMKIIYDDETINPDTSEWIECRELPDVNTLKGSALDVSGFLDAPAGRHGFIRRNGEKMEFSDGTRARFWGVNIVGEACFLEKEDADRLIERIACAGFNLVRFHHMDAPWVKPNIFGAAGNTTRRIDEEAIDRFEYMWAECKKRGIYFMVDPLCTRTAHSETDGTDSNSGFKASAVFSPELQELQKEYVMQLFSHVSPYTDTCLRDEPALVFVDIINEDSMLWSNAATWAMKDNRELYKSFNGIFTEWLKKRYSGISELREKWSDGLGEGLLENEDFEKGISVPLDFNTDGIDRLSDAKQSDIRRFVTELQRDYYVKMLEFYRKNVGLKCLICGSNAPTYPDTADLYANTACGADFLDQHAYYGGTAWGTFWLEDNLKMFTICESSFSDINRTILDTFQERRVYGVPYVQSEWNQVEPNIYSAEALPLMAAYGSLFGWNPVCFAYLQGKPTRVPKLSMTFNIYEVPTKYSIAPICGLMFQRGDVSETEDGFYVTVSPDEAIANPHFDSKIPRDVKRITKTGLYFTDSDSEEPDLSAGNERVLRFLESTKKDNTLTSTTGELKWHNGVGTVIDTEYSSGCAGFVGGKRFETQNAVFNIESRHAAVIISSLTREKISDSKHLLLTAVGGWRMKNERISPDGKTLVCAGEPPMLVQPVCGRVTVRSGVEYDVYRLGFSGERLGKAETALTDAGFEIILKNENRALNYELVRR